MDYLPLFMDGCEATGIPTQRYGPQEALAVEPMLNPELKAAVRVPDATMDAMRMPHALLRHRQGQRRASS